jgi:hypothetical protein
MITGECKAMMISNRTGRCPDFRKIPFYTVEQQLSGDSLGTHSDDIRNGLHQQQEQYRTKKSITRATPIINIL